MTYRPAFFSVTFTNHTLVIEGRSLLANYQVDIVVTVVQGGLYGTAHAVDAVPKWRAEIKEADLKPWPQFIAPPPEVPFVQPPPAPPADDFDPTKPIELFGTEIRINPFTAITWQQQLTL